MLKVDKQYSPFGGGKQAPDRLIIHAMGEHIDTEEKDFYAPDWLNHLKLSCHFLIKPDGEVIKMRHTHDIAWHAKGHNTNTVGIEFLVEGLYTYETFLSTIKTDWVTPKQYEAGIELSQEIIEHYNIPVESVLRHSDISPGRKHDPGSGFRWDWFKDMLFGI